MPDSSFISSISKAVALGESLDASTDDIMSVSYDYAGYIADDISGCSEADVIAAIGSGKKTRRYQLSALEFTVCGSDYMTFLVDSSGLETLKTALGGSLAYLTVSDNCFFVFTAGEEKYVDDMTGTITTLQNDGTIVTEGTENLTALQSKLKMLDPNGWETLEDAEKNDVAVLKDAIASIEKMNEASDIVKGGYYSGEGTDWTVDVISGSTVTARDVNTDKLRKFSTDEFKTKMTFVMKSMLGESAENEGVALVAKYTTMKWTELKTTLVKAATAFRFGLTLESQSEIDSGDKQTLSTWITKALHELRADSKVQKYKLGRADDDLSYAASSPDVGDKIHYLERAIFTIEKANNAIVTEATISEATAGKSVTESVDTSSARSVYIDQAKDICSEIQDEILRTDPKTVKAGWAERAQDAADTVEGGLESLEDITDEPSRFKKSSKPVLNSAKYLNVLLKSNKSAELVKVISSLVSV